MIRGIRLVSFAVAAMSPALLSAQSGPPMFVASRPPLMRVRVDGVDVMLDSLAKLRVFPLLEEYGLVDRIRTKVRWEESVERVRLVRREAGRAGLKLEPHQLDNLLSSQQVAAMQVFPNEEVRRLEMQMFSAPFVGGFDRGWVSVISCSPRAQGRWAKMFEDEIDWWRGCSWFEPVPDVKIGGLPVAAFTKAGAAADVGDAEAVPTRWFLQIPGAFVSGSAAREQLGDLGTFELSSPQSPPGVRYELDLGGIAGASEDGGALGMFGLFEQLMLGGFARVALGAHLEGDLVREFLEVERADTGDGKATLASALLAGEGPLPPQALPDGALLQVRCRVAVDELFRMLEELGALEGIDVEQQRQLRSVYDGSLAFGVCAPAPGGLIPRGFLTLGLNDVEACRELMAGMSERGLPCREVVYDGVTCHVLDVPGMPQGVQPAFGVVDGRLHLAESGASLRALLRAQRSGAEAMPIPDAIEPDEVPGDRLATFDLRFDPARTYRAFYELWMPLLVMSLDVGGKDGISRDDMPDPDEFAEYARPVRAAFFRDGERVSVHTSGVLGGPIATCYLAVLPFLSASQGNSRYDPLAGPLARHKLENAWTAIESFKAREGRLPKGLAELFASEKLADDALLMPGDPEAEQVPLAGGRTVRTSFRYCVDPVAVEVFGRVHHALLLGIEPGFARVLLDRRGGVQDVWGDAADRPIDEFQVVEQGADGGR